VAELEGDGCGSMQEEQADRQEELEDKFFVSCTYSGEKFSEIARKYATEDPIY
jgi:hypothetical protein